MLVIDAAADPVIASVSDAIQGSTLDCFVASAPLRKRFAFVAGDDDRA
jgi:hypothetical protein